MDTGSDMDATSHLDACPVAYAYMDASFHLDACATAHAYAHGFSYKYPCADPHNDTTTDAVQSISYCYALAYPYTYITANGHSHPHSRPNSPARSIRRFSSRDIKRFASRLGLFKFARSRVSGSYKESR